MTDEKADELIKKIDELQASMKKMEKKIKEISNSSKTVMKDFALYASRFDREIENIEWHQKIIYHACMGSTDEIANPSVRAKAEKFNRKLKG